MGIIVDRPVAKVLIFEIGGQRYGLPASDVRELVRAVAILPLPLESAFIEGVFDLRGTIVPVVDLRARLRLPFKAVEPSDHLIIIEAGAGGRPLALRVDRALDLVVWDPAASEQVQELMPGSGDAILVDDDESARWARALARLPFADRHDPVGRTSPGPRVAHNGKGRRS